MNNKYILIQLFLAACFAGTVFCAENNTKPLLSAPRITYPTFISNYSIKYPLYIKNGGVYDYLLEEVRHEFSQKTALCENTIDGVTPERIYPFNFTSGGDYVCYYLEFPPTELYSQKQPPKNRIQLRDCGTAEIVKLFPAEWKPEYGPFFILPRAPVISPDKKLVAILGSQWQPFNNRSELDHLKRLEPQKYIFFLDWENSNILDYVNTRENVNPVIDFQTPPSERSGENRVYNNNSVLFTPDSQKAIIRISDHQVDLYNLNTRLIEKSFNLAHITPGAKEIIGTFGWTEDNFLRTNVISNYNFPFRDTDAIYDNMGNFIVELGYIDWDIETGEIVREGGIPFPTN